MLKKIPTPIWLIVFGLLLFLPGLGGVPLFDWDEANFAECAREMLVSANFLQVQIDFKPFWEKPPGFFWLQALSMANLGINEFAARLPNAIIGILGALFVYRTGRRIQNHQFGLLWALLLMTSTLPMVYYRSGIIDPGLNLAILIALVSFEFSRIEVPEIHSPKNRWMWLWSGVWIGIATLLKGQVAMVVAGFALATDTLFFKKRPLWLPSILQGIGMIAVAIAVASLWFGLEWLQNGPWFLKTFLTYQIRLLSEKDAGHGGFFGYHPIVLFLGCFPASVFAVHTLKNPWKEWTSWDRFFLALLLSVVVLFSVVQTKIVHYSSLAYFPITYFGAKALLASWKDGMDILKSKITKILLIVIGTVTVTPSFIVPFLKTTSPTEMNLWPLLVGLFSVVVLGWYLKLLFSKRSFEALITLLVVWGLSGTLRFSTLFPEIESMTQGGLRALISKAKSLESGRPIYLQTVHMKSFLHYFYGDAQPIKNLDYQRSDFQQWLLTDQRVDRPTYFLTRPDEVTSLLQSYPLEKIAEDRGYTLLKRTGLSIANLPTSGY